MALAGPLSTLQDALQQEIPGRCFEKNNEINLLPTLPLVLNAVWRFYWLLSGLLYKLGRALPGFR